MKRAFVLLIAALIIAAPYVLAETEEFMFADALPKEIYYPAQHQGTVVPIEYKSRDYAGDESEITKHALVYLPYGYDENERYDLLILCHGIGGTENEWGFGKQVCTSRCAADHLIEEKEVKPFIIVCPNGRSTKDCYNTSMGNAASFYAFGNELRNDLLPYIDQNFATYGHDTLDDISASRDHRAMAGLSMGGMQTINIGLCECIDLFSAFGAFSAAPTSYTSSVIDAKVRAQGEYEIKYFYSVCGTEDGIAYASASAAAKNLLDYSDIFSEANWHWQERSGAHSFAIWDLGFYNFVRLLGHLK